MFQYVSDKKLLAFPVKECGEKFVSVKDLHPKIVSRKKKPREIKRWVVSSYGHLVRKTVAKKLIRIAEGLPLGMKLIVTDGYRPIEIQRRMFRGMMKVFKKKKKYRKLREDEIKEKVRKLCADPDSYTYHSTGGVVDVYLEKDGKAINIGTAKNTFDKRLGKEARKNRGILIRAMSKVGFVNYIHEWWHWCYGESLWASINKKRYAIYGSVHLKNLKKFL